jgi:aminopeptidase YwaD
MKFDKLCIERPIGSNGNNEILDLLINEFKRLKYHTIELPFNCTIWKSNNSFISQNMNKIKIYPSPYSKSLKGIFQIKYVSTMEVLLNLNRYNGILVFTDKLSQKGVMPKNFPFYFPDEDKLLYETIEKINPKGIIAITGQDESSGLNPFPIFEDINLKIPTAYVSSLEGIIEGNKVPVEINSKTNKTESKQIIFRKEGLSKEIIIIAAHMDTKYFTDGALDNAAGIYTLCEIARLIENMETKYTVEIVPFNGEDSPEVSGQLEYLNYLERNGYQINYMINIDGAGHIGSENMFSFYNYEDNIKNEILEKTNLLEGEQWYSGDHGIFIFQEIPCIAITSSDMFGDAIKLTHSKKDKMEIVNIQLLKDLSQTIKKIIEIIDTK